MLCRLLYAMLWVSREWFVGEKKTSQEDCTKGSKIVSKLGAKKVKVTWGETQSGGEVYMGRRGTIMEAPRLEGRMFY